MTEVSDYEDNVNSSKIPCWAILTLIQRILHKITRLNMTVDQGNDDKLLIAAFLLFDRS